MFVLRLDALTGVGVTQQASRPDFAIQRNMGHETPANLEGPLAYCYATTPRAFNGFLSSYNAINTTISLSYKTINPAVSFPN